MDALPEADRHLAELLVAQGLCTRGQVDECRALLQRLAENGVRPIPPLGQILAQKGYLGEPASRTVPPEAPAPERRVDRYVLEERLGAGGMGEVWRARDPILGRTVALKFLRYDDPQDVERFRREAQIAAQISHPNLAAVYEFGEHGGRPYLSMQFISGGTLRSVGRGDPRLIAKLIRDAARAVQAAHDRGVIHRDLKPDNLMIEGDRVYVMDFGLAKRVAVDATASGILTGTPAYMAPEQASGQSLDPRADVWALGATMYDLLSGSPPFPGTEVLEILRRIVTEEPRPLRKVPQDLATIVMKCLEKERARRYATAEDLAADLDRWLAGEAIRAHPPTAMYRLRKHVRRHRPAYAAAGLAVAAIAVTLAIFVPRWLAERRAREWEQARRAAMDRARPHVDEARKLLNALHAIRTQKDHPRAEAEAIAARAEEELRRALEIAPSHPEALLESARLWIVREDPARAEAACTEAIRSDPQFAGAYLLRAILRLMVHHFAGEGCRVERVDEGIGSDLEAARAWSRESWQLEFAEGLLLLHQRRRAEAATKLEEYAGRARSDPQAWGWAAHAHSHVGNHDRAEQMCANGLRFFPDSWKLLLQRAEARRALWKLPEALEDALEAVRLRPSDASTWLELCRVRIARHEFDGAREAAERGVACADSRSTPDALWLRAEVRFQQGLEMKEGRADEARRLFTDALVEFAQAHEARPASRAFRTGRIKALVALGRFAEARAICDEAIDRNPRDGQAWLDRAYVHRNSGTPESAIADADRAIELLGSEAAAAYELRAHARALLGQTEAAIVDFTRAIEEGVDLAATWYNRGSLRFQLNRPREAVEDFSEALRRDPKYLSAWKKRARARMVLKDDPGVVEDLTRALELHPCVDCRSNRAMAKARLEDFEGAAADLEQVLETAPKNWPDRAMTEKYLEQVRADLKRRKP